MSSKHKNRVLETTATIGVEPYALAGAVLGFQTAQSAGCDVGASYSYYVEGIDERGALTGDFEIGEGVYSVGFLTPVTVSDSSNGGSKVAWPAGAKRIGLTVTANALALLGVSDTTLINGATRLIQTQRIMAQLVSRGQI